MTSNYLKLNEDKTEVIVFSHKPLQDGTLMNSIDIGGHTIKPVSSVRNLGVELDSSLTMIPHITKVCKGAFFVLRNLSRIRRYLSSDAAKMLVHSFVSAKLDYGNALLLGVHKKHLKKLQRVLHSAARVVAMVGRRESITPILQDLHWLPVKQRIEYKAILLCFKGIHAQAPPYLSTLVQIYKPTRALRSTNHTKVVPPGYRYERIGAHAFANSASSLFNALPENLRDEEDIET